MLRAGHDVLHRRESNASGMETNSEILNLMLLMKAHSGLTFYRRDLNIYKYPNSMLFFFVFNNKPKYPIQIQKIPFSSPASALCTQYLPIHPKHFPIVRNHTF